MWCQVIHPKITCCVDAIIQIKVTDMAMKMPFTIKENFTPMLIGGSGRFDTSIEPIKFALLLTCISIPNRGKMTKKTVLCSPNRII